MKIAILLHSTTGNTRVVTRYAASYLGAAGHECTVHDIVKMKDPAVIDEADALCVACPTFYFRPTFGMERAIARINPAIDGPKPAFLLASCMGEPGAHFALLAEWLRNKDYIALGAKWVLAPSNWPTHIAAMQKLESTTAIGTWLNHLHRPLRPLWGSIWPYCVIPDEKDRQELNEFLDEVMNKLESGNLDDAPWSEQLHHNMPTTNVQGRIFPREHLEKLNMRIHAELCSKCGTCVLLCPVGVIKRDSDDTAPTIEQGCTGCYACFNRCPEGAISSLGTPAGEGQYKGPPAAMKEVFRPLKIART